ncbi:MAG: hypothetical protein IH614_12895 [Desulfuromonadales bacterium]|nr:hypothetical protein [Desulfuromonadales bacterium]
MAGVFFALMVIAYLVFLIDWKELRDVLAQGGWASVVVYGIVGVLIAITLASPSAGPVMHH